MTIRSHFEINLKSQEDDEKSEKTYMHEMNKKINNCAQLDSWYL